MANELGEIIPVDEVQRTPRGRKATYDSGLLELMERLTPDTAVRLPGMQTPAKEQRSSVSANIRKHFTAVHGEDTKCRIEYTADGVPQVKFLGS